MAVFDTKTIARKQLEFKGLASNLKNLRTWGQAFELQEGLRVWLEDLKLAVDRLVQRMPTEKKNRDAILNTFVHHAEILPNIPTWGYTLKVPPGTPIDQKSLNAISRWGTTIRKHAKDLWAWLEGIITSTSVEEVVRASQNIELEGFRVRLDFFTPEHESKIQVLSAGLKKYRTLAKARFPWLLRYALPLRIDFSDGKSFGAAYEGTHIDISMFPLSQDGVEDLPHVIAHEMGHHIYQTRLSEQDQTAWFELTKGKVEIDLADHLDDLDNLLSGLSETNPELYVRLMSLETTARGGVPSRADVEELIARGENTIVRVPKLTITGYAAKNSEEAFCEALGMLVGYGPRTIPTLAKVFMQKLIPEVRIANAYLAKQAGVYRLTVKDVEKWKSDLRRMTKVYKDVSTDYMDEDGFEDKQKLQALWLEWKQIERVFNVFKNNFEHWVYKVLLPQAENDKGVFAEEIRKKAWSALAAFDLYGLFPTVNDRSGYGKTPAPWKLKADRDKIVLKYQKYFLEAFKTITFYIESREVERFEDEQFTLAGMNINIPGYNRTREDEPILVEYLSALEGHAKRVQRAGFGKVLRDLRVEISFDRPKGLTAAQYRVSEDRVTIFPLGMYGEGHGTFAHELGHRFWYKFLSPNARAHWEEVISTHQTEITEADVVKFHKLVAPLLEGKKTWDYPTPQELAAYTSKRAVDALEAARFRELADVTLTNFNDTPYIEVLKLRVGDAVLLENLSDYGAESPIEAFAEAFRLFVDGKPLGPITGSLFRKLVISGGVNV
jgi:hypothetical protein